jgi:hypothetical protein
MDISRRAWNGSSRAKAFYAEQQRLWVELLMKFLSNRSVVEEMLQLFQGAVLTYLITGDPEPGKRSLEHSAPIRIEIRKRQKNELASLKRLSYLRYQSIDPGLSATRKLATWPSSRQLGHLPVIHPHEIERIGKHKPTFED